MISHAHVSKPFWQLHNFTLHRLTPEQRQSLQLNPQDATEDEEVTSATQFGNLCKKRGDEVDSVIRKVREEAKDFTDVAAEDEDPSQALQHLLEVAQTVFEVGEDGLGKNMCCVVKKCIELLSVYTCSTTRINPI